MSKEFNIAKVKLNGTDWGTRSGTIESFGGMSRESTSGSGKITGYVETPTACVINVTFLVNSETDTEAIRNFKGICEFELDTGQLYSTSEAYGTDTGRLNPGTDGGVAMVISGLEAQRVV